MIYTYLISLSDYADIHYQGYSSTGVISDGKPLVLRREEAVNNAIKLLLLSQQGDYGRYTQKGGVLFNILNSSASDGVDEAIKTAVKKALAEYTNIVIQDVTVVRDDRGERWKITVFYMDLYNKLVASTSVSVVEKI